MAKIKGREMQTQGQHTMCYRRGNQSSRRKTSLLPSKAVNNPLKNIVGIHEQQKTHIVVGVVSYWLQTNSKMGRAGKP